MTLFTQNIDHVLEIQIGGTLYGGWTSASVTRSVKEMSGQFNLTLHDPQMLLLGSPAYAQFSAAAEPGTDVTILVDGELFLTGKIDTRSATKDAESHNVTISGRGKSRDLIDSDHDDETTQYNKVKPSDVLKKVAQKHGLNVQLRGLQEKLVEVYRYRKGDRSFRVATELLRQQGITVNEDKNGILVARGQDKGAAAGPLIQGGNLLSYNVEKSDKDKAAEYKGKGQSVPGNRVRGKPAFTPNHTVKDGATKGRRTMIVTTPGDADREKVKKRTLHEAARRAGYSLQVGVTLYGYRGSGGGLWEPDTLAMTYIPDEGIAEPLLIESVTFKKDQGGTITDLKLTRKEAYEAKPQTGKKQGAKAKVGGGSPAPKIVLRNG